MKKITGMLLAMLLFCSFTANQKVTIWMIGDSTMANKNPKVAPECGWGTELSKLANEGVWIRNRAQNGRSTKSYLAKRWKDVYDNIQPGDYVIIQFGHNDRREDTLVHTEPFTSYKENLKRFITETRSKGGIPVLCSSIVQRHFDGNTLKNTHGDYLIAAKQVADETQTPFVDMEKLTRKLIQEMGPEKSKELYLFCKPGEYPTRPEGVQDSTHLNTRGAEEEARLFVNDIKKQQLEIAKYFK